MSDKPLGVYIHIPFCASKCPYCDFYSVTADEDLYDKYIDAVIKSVQAWLAKIQRPVDTVYFGGGTPSVIGAGRLDRVLQSVNIYKTENAEITVECNPSSVYKGFFEGIRLAGANRISMGLQSSVDSERKSLGRRAGVRDAERAIELARLSGFSNISLDLMLGIPGQTLNSLRESVDFCIKSDVTHVSAYILKIEENTPFYSLKDSLNLPDEDEQCKLYLYVCEALDCAGFRQYEISNFAKRGFESRHNLKYWHCEEYLGIGCSAHSFIDGKRFYYKRDIDSFINGCMPVEDGCGGSSEEYSMLALRLTEGLTQKVFASRFGRLIPDDMFERAKKYERLGLTVCDQNGIRLTPKGFLVSNSIIAELLMYL
jgi:oxygen-independent coproporphyrinogen-3 oxidase